MSQGNDKGYMEALFRATIGTILDRLERGKRERREVDKILYKEIIETIPPEMMRDFFSQLEIKQFWNCHARKIVTYLEYISPILGKEFFDKKIQKAKRIFDKSLEELMNFVSKEFFYSDHVENLFLLQPELKKRAWTHKEDAMHYDELVQQLHILRKGTERSYESFIKIVQKRLHI